MGKCMYDENVKDKNRRASIILWDQTLRCHAQWFQPCFSHKSLRHQTSMSWAASESFVSICLLLCCLLLHSPYWFMTAALIYKKQLFHHTFTLVSASMHYVLIHALHWFYMLPIFSILSYFFHTLIVIFVHVYVWRGAPGLPALFPSAGGADHNMHLLYGAGKCDQTTDNMLHGE
jgi:hypothetical protein